VPVLTKRIRDRVIALLDADSVVAENSRWRIACYELVCGSESIALVVDDGGVRSVANIELQSTPVIKISGTEDQWRTVLDGLHGGLHRAWRYRLLDFDGDPLVMMSLWKTLWRLGEALVAAQREAA